MYCGSFQKENMKLKKFENMDSQWREIFELLGDEESWPERGLRKLRPSRKKVEFVPVKIQEGDFFFLSTKNICSLSH